MNKIVIIGGIILGVLLLNGCKKENESGRIFNRKYIKVIKEARNETFFYFARNFIPGGSIAVSVKGKLVWSEGIGQASTDLEVPATRFTKFRIGQMSQILTSLAYYQLVEKGLLDPNESVSKLLPDFPEKKFPLYLQHLVDQTSGIRPPSDQELLSADLYVTLNKGIEKFSGDSLLFPPGMYQYPSNYSYNLLGAAMEQKTGETFSKIISKWVTDTLHLENTVPDNPLLTIKERSNFFNRNMIAQTMNAITIDLRSNLPSNGYLSTADDLVKLGNALLFSPVLTDSVKHKMLTPPVINNEFKASWGNGLMFLTDRQGIPFYASRGLVRGSGSILIIIPEEQIVLACLSNLNDDVEELPGLKVAFMFRDFLKGTFNKKQEAKEPADSSKTRK